MAKGFKHGGAAGGAVSGGTLVVMAPAGVSATVSSDEKGKTYTKTVGSDGKATFSGITTGDWNVTIASETQTASKVVTVVTDYTETLAFFSATINVSYPPGSTCTATDGVTKLYAPDTSGTWECVVPNAGTWTITCKNEDKEKSVYVDITEDGQSEQISISYQYFVFDGENVADYTGAWSGNGSSSGGVLSVTNGGYNDFVLNSYLSSAELIDMSDYSTLHFIVSEYNTYGQKKFGLGTTTVTNSYDIASVSVTGKNEYTIDIQSVDSCFIKLFCGGFQAGSGGYETGGYAVSKIWLE